MAESWLFYYITDRSAFPGDEPARRKRLLDKIAEAARVGIDYIQLREKDLPTRDLECLAREAVGLLNTIRAEDRELNTKLLINSRTDVALATGADGVHLRSDDISPHEVRNIWKKAGCGAGALAREDHVQTPAIGVSCHDAQQTTRAAAEGADFAVFAPVFEKEGATPTGLKFLREACRAKIPVLALGGVTTENAQSCLEAGAAGIAGIRLFQENDIADVVRQLVGLTRSKLSP
jgi:thiamine-phosphate pyrophosphorylase